MREKKRVTEYELLSAFKTKGRDNKKNSSSDEWKEFDLEHLSGWKFKEDFPGRTRYQSPIRRLLQREKSTDEVPASELQQRHHYSHEKQLQV